jgi:hypothetical protein
MKTIYIVYECNEFETYESMCIKHLCTNLTLSKEIFKKMKKEYDKTNWYLNLASYDPKKVARSGDNILKDMVLILTTKNND